MHDACDAWFSTLGEPLGAAEFDDIAAYLRGFALDAGDPPLAVRSWEEAAAIVRQPAGPWWEKEEAERRRLESLVRLDATDGDWIRLNDALHGAAAVAAARAGYARADMIKVAAGSASFAAHQHQLARAARLGADHPFARKHALFSGGRWPLGIYGGRFAVF